MTRIVKHIPLQGGCACLLDNGFVEVLGNSPNLREVRETMEYMDNVVDIANQWDKDMHVFVNGFFYKRQDQEQWEATSGAMTEIQYTGGNKSIKDPYTHSPGYLAFAGILACAIEQRYHLPYSWVIIDKKNDEIPFDVHNAGKPLKCLSYIYASGNPSVWCVLTDKGECYRKSPDCKWEHIFMSAKVKDIFLVDKQCMFLLENGLLYSSFANIPEYLDVVKQKE